MRKICSLILGMLLMCSALWGRTLEEAAAIASGFLSHKDAAASVSQRVRAAKSAAIPSPQVSLAFTQTSPADEDALYVFNHDKGGFVWVSASDYTREVLGYSDTGYFDKNNIPVNMQYWLSMYAHEIARADANPPALAANLPLSTTYPIISPLLGNVIWGQDAPFNNLCPTMDSAHCPTGCVATAISQIMYKHKHPIKGTGSFSYTISDDVSVSANFAKTTYDWHHMLPDYSAGYTSTQASAVATLLYHVGVASGMSYGIDGSGALGQIAMNGLIDYFDYDADITVWQKDFHLDDERIMQAIATDLQAGRPVYMEAYTVNQEGHAFLCDGMQSDGYLHINWGWNGLSNGYFALSALDPELQGTGGSSGNYAFNVQVAVYTGIQPERGGVAKPLMTADKFTRTSADVIPRDEFVEFTIEYFCNRGVGSNVGQLMYRYYDANNNLVDYVNLSDISELNPLDGWYEYYVWGIVPAWMPDGDYELEIGCLNSHGYYHPVYVWKEGAARYPFTISGNTIRFESDTLNHPAYDFTIRVKKAANCDMDISNGVWLWWWNTGQDGQCVPTTLDADGWYTATITSTQSSINCIAANQDLDVDDRYAAHTNDYMNITGDICLQIQGDADTYYILNPVSCSADPDCYTLTLTANEGGYVEVFSPYQDCYEAGESVDIQAVAYEGYVFSHWSDNLTSASRTVLMNRNIQLQAIFVDAASAYDVKNLKLSSSKLNLTIKWTSTATRFEVTIQDKDDQVILCDTVDNEEANKVYKHKVPKYGKYTVSVKPFDDDDQQIGKLATKSLVVELKYSLSISAGVGGTVNEEVNGSYAADATVEIIATAKEGYIFLRWCDGNTNATRTLTMDQDYELMALFTPNVGVENIYDGLTIDVQSRTIMVEASQSQDFALYDMVGHLLSQQVHTLSAHFRVPSAGLYILRTSNGYLKIRVE